jgi:hypothetical protein
MYLQKVICRKTVFCWRLEGENQCWIRDPVPFLTPGSGVMGQKTGSGSGMNNPDHISESLETNFLGYKILKLCEADPGSGMEKFGSGIRNTGENQREHISNNSIEKKCAEEGLTS